MNACDGDNMLNYTIWDYCPDNSHEWGDLWNGEDLSIWSPDDRVFQTSSYTEYSKRHGRRLGRPHAHAYGPKRLETSNFGSSTASLPDLDDVFSRQGVGSMLSRSVDDIDLPGTGVETDNLHDGARALVAYCRPYPVKTAGTPTYLNFDMASASFDLRIIGGGGDPSEIETEIFVPAVHFGKSPQDSIGLEFKPDVPAMSGFDAELDLQVTTSGGSWRINGQHLLWRHPPGKQSIQVRRAGGPLSLYPQSNGRTW